MLGLARCEQRSIRRGQEVGARVRHKVDLELVDVNVQGTVKAKRR